MLSQDLSKGRSRALETWPRVKLETYASAGSGPEQLAKWVPVSSFQYPTCLPHIFRTMGQLLACKAITVVKSQLPRKFQSLLRSQNVTHHHGHRSEREKPEEHWVRKKDQEDSAEPKAE